MASGGGRRNSSDQNHQKNEGSSLKTTLIAGGVGLALGAAAAYLFSSASETEQRSSHPVQQTQRSTRSSQSGHPIRPSNKQLDPSSANNPPCTQSLADRNTTSIPHDIGGSSECCICKETFDFLIKSDVEILSLGCGHLFCQDCIYASLQESPRCPKCREVIKRGDTRRIYF